MALNADQKRAKKAYEEAIANAAEQVAEASKEGNFEKANQWQVIVNQNQSKLDALGDG